MPIKIRRAFEREYGKKRGDRIFYSWENKHRRHELNEYHPRRTGIIMLPKPARPRKPFVKLGRKNYIDKFSKLNEKKVWGRTGLL